MMELDESSGNKVALPESWIELQVKEAVINISTTDRKIPQKFYLESGAFPVIDQGRNYIGGYTNNESMLVDCDLPVIIFGDHTKAIKHVNQRFAAGADGVKVLKPLQFLEPSFSFYTLLNAATRLKSKGYARHFQEFSKLKIKIPPLPEQVRIVAKLEELFSELDQGVEYLRTAQQQLKVYRQALLKHAFEGKLTADWRAQNPDKLESAEALLARIQKEREARYQQQIAEWREAQQAWEAASKTGSKPTKPKTPKVQPPLTTEELTELPDLPEGWAWGRLGYMTCGVEYGTAAKSSETGKVAVLRMGNIQNSRFDWQDLVYTDDADEIAKYSLRHDDVLFNRTNSPELVGKAAIYKSEQPALFAGYLIRINQIGTIAKAQFVNLFLASHVAKQHGSKVKTDGVNQSNINGEKLANYPFPYCHASEQDAVVAVLEDKLSNLEQLESTITTSLQQAEALRQSILKKAFSGQLVPQSPDDEPASVLLERIRSERTAQQPARKRGRKVATSA
ncbi:Type-1 restriction enzyme EcoKI specificity protein [compost metagenome]